MDWALVAGCVIEVHESARACAAVGAWGAATEEREVLVGRNLDWFNVGKLHEHAVLVVRHPAKGRPFASLAFPGLVGVLTGMNDAGLFVADLVQIRRGAPPPAKGAVPVMSLQRLMLERCSTADEAVELLESTPRTVPQNYIIADATRAWFLETDSEKVVRRESLNDVVVGTNYAAERRGVAKTDMRFGMLCACIDPCVGKIGVPEIEKALAAANAGPLSVMSVVAAPARRALRVSAGKVPACMGPFVDVDVARLLSASAPESTAAPAAGGK
jgi:hypothetical protein